MAGLEVVSDLFTPGRWTVRSEHAGALAATCDALVQSLGLDGESLAVWGRHYDEQNERVEDAYANERQLIGPSAAAQVVALPREPRPNWVWVDRLHLVAVGVRPAVGSQLLGLYVGSNGRMVLAVHHPSVTAQLQQVVVAMPHSDGRDWDTPALVDQCRAVIAYDSDAPNEVQVRAPQSMALSVQDALMRLQGLVAAW